MIEKYGVEYTATNFPEFQSIRSGLYKIRERFIQNYQPIWTSNFRRFYCY
jgi:hypothetical protein